LPLYILQLFLGPINNSPALNKGLLEFFLKVRLKGIYLARDSEGEEKKCNAKNNGDDY